MVQWLDLTASVEAEEVPATAEEGVQQAQAPQIIPRGDGDYVLVRKGSISAGGVVNM